MAKTNDYYADAMLGQINACIEEQLKNLPSVRSAIVKNVNPDGSVDVVVPPDVEQVFTKITNQTPFVLEEGDSVEMLLKGGNLNNCWIIAKHNSAQTTAWNNMNSHVGMIIQTTTLDTEAKVIALYGGKHWRRIQGRFLMGADDSHDVGSEIEAGLPNITGGCNYFGHTSGVSWGLNTSDSGWFGSMYSFNGGGNCYAKYTNGTLYPSSTKPAGIGLDASRSNSIYGNSDTVQPPSFVVYIWERTE